MNGCFSTCTCSEQRMQLSKESAMLGPGSLPWTMPMVFGYCWKIYCWSGIGCHGLLTSQALIVVNCRYWQSFLACIDRCEELLNHRIVCGDFNWPSDQSDQSGPKNWSKHGQGSSPVNGLFNVLGFCWFYTVFIPSLYYRVCSTGWPKFNSQILEDTQVGYTSHQTDWAQDTSF